MFSAWLFLILGEALNSEFNPFFLTDLYDSVVKLVFHHDAFAEDTCRKLDSH